MKSMTRKRYLLLVYFLGISFFSISNSSLQTKINYRCIGQDSFIITLQKVIDCSISTDSLPDTVRIQVSNICSTNYDLILTNKNIYDPFPCLRSTCYGGDLPGTKMLEYSAIVNLNSLCSEWTLSFTECCLDSSKNLIGTPAVYTETRINMYAGNCNNSPTLNSNIFFAKKNELNSFNFSCTSTTGAFLNYYLVAPLVSKDTTVLFQNGFSESQPIPGITLDSITGLLEFTPTSLGKYYAAILVNEITPNASVIVSSSIINILIDVKELNNNNPISYNGIENISGNLKPFGIDTFQVGNSEKISFDIIFKDYDQFDSITLYSNSEGILPNSTLKTFNGNPAKFSFNWKSSKNNGIYTFTTIAEDNNCQAGLSTRNFTIIVGTGINSIINQNLTKNNLKIYPNPLINNYLNIEFKQPMEESFLLSVYDNAGTLKKTYQSNQTTDLKLFTINLNQLPIGMYTLHFQCEKFSKSLPFIKVK